MTKKEMIKEVAEKTGFTQKDITAVVDATMETIVDKVKVGEDVKLSGFGTFELVERAERQGRNPQTGETIMIEATKAPKFKASQGFKNAVKGE